MCQVTSVPAEASHAGALPQGVPSGRLQLDRQQPRSEPEWGPDIRERSASLWRALRILSLAGKESTPAPPPASSPQASRFPSLFYLKNKEVDGEVDSYRLFLPQTPEHWRTVSCRPWGPPTSTI